MNRTHSTEHPDIDIAAEAAVLLAAGWIDQSWHNDVCPRFVSADNARVLWIDHADPEQRETMGARFIVQALDVDGEIDWDLDALLATDDWAEVLQFIGL
jgi:hypothetical protein